MSSWPLKALLHFFFPSYWYILFFTEDYFWVSFIQCDLPFRIQTMSTLLKEKEESLRNLKVALRKSQQQGEDSSKSAVKCECMFQLFFNLCLYLWNIIHPEKYIWKSLTKCVFIYKQLNLQIWERPKIWWINTKQANFVVVVISAQQFYNELFNHSLHHI